MPFADALRAAVSACGLALDRIQHRLRQRGTPVSVATLSSWQSGRTRPERPGSLAALPHLEDILGIPSGGLSGLLGKPRPRGRGRREARMLPIGALKPHADRVAALLSGLDVDSDPYLIRISQYDRYEYGPDRTQLRAWNRQILRADRDGPDRWVTLFYADEPGSGIPRLRALRNCRLGRTVKDETAGMLAVELLFDRPLHCGETLIMEYELVNLVPQQPATQGSCGRTLRMLTREYLLEAAFHPTALPALCEEFNEPADGGPATSRRIPLDSTGCAHALALNTGPAQFGIRWTWND
ncbi:hypothetical protein A6P39_001750 [Streptomyces sp. FXJ1.172]|uniref:hypothetical protein n=1 Tax=Streptomyces sp. FXJ1.172 TaxID=710705 RepID=UPI000B1FDE80|nr:hypothetical protein [Streptomyces sp. FXJ1.172]WEO92921.1 hypothetical protein A6P39_001750 [Streptomyces sp. FXJ1.172]